MRRISSSYLLFSFAVSTISEEKILFDFFFFRYIVSDCDSIEVMHDSVKWLGYTEEEAVAQVMRAGTNFTAILEVSV